MSPLVDAVKTHDARHAPQLPAWFLEAYVESSRQQPLQRDQVDALVEVDLRFRTVAAAALQEHLAGTLSPVLAADIQQVFVAAANAFQACLRNATSWTAAPEDAALARIAGLAMTSMHLFAKWQGLAEQRPPTAPWPAIHALYAFAEKNECATTSVALHPGLDPQPVSPRQVYAGLLALEEVGAQWPATHRELAEGWLVRACADVAIDATFDASRHAGCLDLAADAGFSVCQDDADSTTLRFPDFREAVTAFHSRRASAAATGQVLMPLDEIEALAARIAAGLARLAPARARRDERLSASGQELRVVLGIAALVRDPHSRGLELAATPEEAPWLANPELRRPELRWKVRDVSAHAYGLLVPAAVTADIPLHALVGVRHPSGWLMPCAVVRKDLERGWAEALVAIEVLGLSPVRVALETRHGTEAGGLFLPGNDEDGREDMLLMREADYRPGQPFTVKADAQSYRVRLRPPLRRGPGWALGSFVVEGAA